MATSDPGPVVQRARLTSELQRIRKDAGRTQEQVARALDWSTSKLIRIEGGDVGISTTDLQALLRHYGVTDPARTDELSKIARGARTRGWWDPYRTDLDHREFFTYVGYEAGASAVFGYSTLFMPGLLQTEDYARALTIEFMPSQALMEAVVELRMLRQQKIFEKETPPEQLYILDEAVIQRRVGGQTDREIMPLQLEHLLDLMSRPYITVEVLPFDKGAHFGLLGEFVFLGFDVDLEGVIYFEGPPVRGGDMTVRDSSHLATYLEAFDRLRNLTLSEAESADFIRTRLQKMRGGDTSIA